MGNNTVTNSRDLLRDLPNVFARSADAGMNVPTYLERQDPSSKYDSKDKSDAFTRILREAAVVTNSNPSAGLYATPLNDLLTGNHIGSDGEPLGKEVGRALAMIWVERRWREAKFAGSASTRNMFTSEEDVIGSMFRPYTDNTNVRRAPLTPAIPISELIAQETGITGSAYRTTYFDTTDLSGFDYARVPEGSEIPVMHLKLREQSVRMWKYGRALDWTYESARNTRLDKMRLAVEMMALGVEAGKVAEIIRVLILGDGNPNTAAIAVNATALDATNAGAWTLKVFLGMKNLFKPPFTLTTLLAQSTEITNLQMMPISSSSTPLIAVPANTGIGQLVPIGNDTTRNNVHYGIVDNGVTGANKALLFDRDAAIERIYEIGANVSEADNFITSQVNVMTFTETEGYAKMNQGSTYLLDLAN
jgi:hypothetical protein